MWIEFNDRCFIPRPRLREKSHREGPGVLSYGLPPHQEDLCTLMDECTHSTTTGTRLKPLHTGTIELRAYYNCKTAEYISHDING